MKQNKLIESLNLCLKKQLDFVAFSPFGSSEVSLLIAENVTRVNFEQLNLKFNDSGFLIAPFNNSENLFWFEPKQFFHNIDEIDLSQLHNIPSCAGKMISTNDDFKEHNFDEYALEFDEYKKKINSGEIKKAILSRLKILNDIEPQRSAKYFNTISKMYPESFAYLVYSAETGLWMGMSPELFMSVEDDYVTTVSLAGTKSVSNMHEEWNFKETEEQDIVTEYIKSICSTFSINDLQTLGPKTVIAGSVAHLRTTFKFPVKNIANSLGEFIKLLHPTPAVCGEPKEKAKALILKTEKHNRELYSGFLGPINLHGKTALYVNIRCMKFYNNKAALYVGGGITKGSNVQEEWEETEMKSQSLLSIVLNS